MSTSAISSLPQCTFYERTPVESGFRYKRIHVEGWHRDGVLRTAYPPMPGDLIYLQGVYRVIEHAWTHSQYGSANWPLGSAMPLVGPMVDIFLEAAEGPFRNEVSDEETEVEGDHE